jgi:hypothetical protein
MFNYNMLRRARGNVEAVAEQRHGPTLDIPEEKL